MSELSERVRAAHRNYPTGVTVITTSVDGEPYGLAVNAFSSVSMEPPTLLFCVNESSKTHDQLIRATHVGVNILGGEQHDVAAVFATSGGDKFSQIEWTAGLEGIPLIAGAAAHFQTEVSHTTKVGTHTVFFCTVLDAEAAEHEPLLYLRGDFHNARKVTDSS